MSPRRINESGFVILSNFSISIIVFFTVTFFSTNTLFNDKLPSKPKCKSVIIRFFSEPVDNKAHRCFIDGGVFAINPALSAYAEFRYHNPELYAKDTMMLSLGTGRQSTHLDCEITSSRGAAEWLYQGGFMTSNAISSVSDYQLKAVYDSASNYLRLDGLFDENHSSSMDNSKNDYLDYLVSLGESIANERQSEIEAFAQKLVESSD